MRIVAVIVDEVPVASATCSKQKVKRGGWCFVGRPCFEEHCRPDWCPLMTAERDRAVQMVAKLIEAGNAMAGAFRLIAKLNSMGYSGPMYVWHALVDEWKEQK